MAYIGRQLVRGQNRVLDDISSSFNGSTTAFNLTVSSSSSPPASVNQLWIILGGVLQKPGTDFTVADAVLTFTTAPASTLSFWGMIQGDTSDINSPADASVTPSKIANSGDFAFPADVRFKDADGSHYVGLQAPSTVSSNLVWSLPAADGSSGQLLKTDGSGNLGWVSDTQSNLLDEDNMSSNSATQPASQQSIKAYVDAGDLSLIDEDNMSTNSATRPPSQQSVKAYADTKAVLTGSTDNTICTVTGANAISGEANLTYNGTNLQIKQTGDTGQELIFDSNRSAANNVLGGIAGYWDTDRVADIWFQSGADTTNKDDGYITFRTSPSQGAIAERLRIASDAVITATQPNSAVGLIVKNTAHDSQLQISATAANKNSTIWFGDAADDDIGIIDYDHNDNSLAFTVNAAERFHIASDGNAKFVHSLGVGNVDSGGATLNVNGSIFASAGGNTTWAKVSLAGSGGSSGDDLSINNWGDAEGDYWTIGVNSTTNNSGASSKTNDAKRSVNVILDGRMGRMILETSQTSTSTRDTTHTWDRGGDYTLTGNVIVANGKGIDFSATSGTGTSELLDDYEEGIFTPQLSGTGNGNVMGLTNGAQKLQYVRIGDLVTITGRVNTDDVNGCAGGIQIGNFPFTPATLDDQSDYAPAWCIPHGVTVPSGCGMTCMFEIYSGGTWFNMYAAKSGSSWQAVQVSGMDSTVGNNWFQFSFSYRTS